MDDSVIRELLAAVHEGKTSVTEALARLRDLPFEDLGFAKVDHHRALRTGYPEAIFCQGKTPQQVVEIAQSQMARDETVFGTRASTEVFRAMAGAVPDLVVSHTGRCFWRKSRDWKARDSIKGTIVVASAGTADSPVVEETRCTVEILGHPCTVVQDVGVAGIHRLLAHKETLAQAGVTIAVAGMEGALPSVIAGMISCPVIGVPTSVGYGAHLDGLVPLFAMLNSCAPGLSVVNIDNGYGAAVAAARMNTV